MTISRKAAESQMDERAAPMTIEARLRFWAEMYNSNMSCKRAGYAYSEKLIQTALEQIERIVSENVTIPRNPVDRDDAAILNAAHSAGYPDAVMTEPATVAAQAAASIGDLDLLQAEHDDYLDLKRTQEDALH